MAELARAGRRAILAASVLLGAGCSERSVPTADLLSNTGWTLRAFVDSDIDQTPSGPNTPTLVFDADGRITGSTGCNDYFGRALFGTGGEIAIGELGTTGAVCGGGFEVQEQRFLMTLEDAVRARVRRDVLELVLEDGSVVLRFERRKPVS